MGNILVTGGAGFIGSFIVDALIEKGHYVRILDKIDPQVHKDGKLPTYLNKKAEFLKGDVTNIDDLRKAIEDIDIIFHEAAAVGIGQSMYKISHYINTNCLGTANLFDLLVNVNHNVKKVILASSFSNYGEGLYKCKQHGIVKPSLRIKEDISKGWELKCVECGREIEPVPTPETTSLDITSIYALTKKMQEEKGFLIGKNYGIPFVALRYFNVYGPRQSLNNPYTGVFAIFMSRIKNNNAPVVYEDGLQTRDFISVHDIVDANLVAMESNAANYEIFNVGTGKPWSIKGIAEILTKLYGKDIKPQITNKFRKGDVRHCYADISKIKSKLGWEPKIAFDDGVKELVDWSKSEEAADMFEQANLELKEKGLL